MTRQQTKNWLLKKINEDFVEVTEQQLSEGKFSPTLDYLAWLCEEYKRLYDVQKNEQYSAMPNDFDEWIEKVEKECVIDMDLPIIIWDDFFKPRGIFPKHAKNNQ